ncbi:DUF2624 family protein [Anaerobacillus sp. HL2]|nr:DUF2624 family protein [Anaerobacillus sp. HL2]
MNPFILQMVFKELNTITKEELIQYAKQYQFSISNEQAAKIITILRSESIDANKYRSKKNISKR